MKNLKLLLVVCLAIFFDLSRAIFAPVVEFVADAWRTLTDRDASPRRLTEHASPPAPFSAVSVKNFLARVAARLTRPALAPERHAL